MRRCYMQMRPCFPADWYALPELTADWWCDHACDTELFRGSATKNSDHGFELRALYLDGQLARGSEHQTIGGRNPPIPE